MQTRVFSTWPCFRPPEMKLRSSCLCRQMPANCIKKDASTSEVQRLHDLQAPPMTNRTCPAHSSSGDSMFVGVHGSSYNSSPSSGGAGPLERHLEAAISRMHSSRQLPPETSRTARPPPHCPAARSRVRPSTLAYGSSSESSGGAGLSRALDI
jgi:hypothetical protein